MILFLNSSLCSQLKKMGKVLSTLSRSVRNYNIENRAQKVISKDKPQLAPKHPTSLQYIHEARDSPTSKEFVKISDEHLQRLKDVYVKSNDDDAGDMKLGEKRLLPQDRTVLPDPEYGFVEPNNVPVGKLTLRQAVDMVFKHQSDPEKWSTEVIAKEFKLELPVTQKILVHFRAYEVTYPPNAKDPKWQAKVQKLIK